MFVCGTILIGNVKIEKSGQVLSLSFLYCRFSSVVHGLNQLEI